MTKPHEIAVVGTGIGMEHLDALAALPSKFSIACVCDIEPDRAATVAEKYGARPETSLVAVLADDEIDIVDLCTPPWLHEQQAVQALQAGKHVVCEKPIAGSLAGIDRINSAAAQASRCVFPVFNYRFGAEYQRFLGIVESGQLGVPLMATIEVGFSRGPEYYATPWRGTIDGELGGCLTSHAIHHFDMLLAALGPPETVSARTATMVNDIETEDCAVGWIEFRASALASFSVTLGCVEEYSRLRFLFTGGAAEFGPGPYGTLGESDWQLGGHMESPAPGVEESSFERMFAEIGRALQGSPSAAPTMEDGRRTIELLTGLYQAAATGHSAAIPIPELSDWYRQWS